MPLSSPRPFARLGLARKIVRRIGVTPVLVAAALAAVVSCSHDSYLKVTLLSADRAFTNVTHVDVKVQGGTAGTTAWLTYVSSEPFSFDTLIAKTLAIAFTPNQSGVVSLEVGVRSGSTCLGNGAIATRIKKGNVDSVTIVVRHSTNCPSESDGGQPDAGSDAITFPGCHPAMPSAMCPASETCFVNCLTSSGMCVAGGTKGPGEICANNADCMPGTQCFDYGRIPGCSAGTRVCQKFCTSDAQCGQAAGGGGGGGGNAGGGGGAGGEATGGVGAGGRGGNAGGGGGTASTSAGSACRNPVVCDGNVVTSYSTCSFACDPRGDATLGCPTGLFCFLYRNGTSAQDSPDCGCRGPTRVGVDGDSCTSSASCAPGHICNMMAGTQVCRRLCKMTSPGDCALPRVCGALQNNNVFGVCVGG